MTVTQADVDTALNLSRSIFVTLPQRVILDSTPPAYGDAYTPNPGIIGGVGHVQVSQNHTPIVRSQQDDLIHEDGHLFEQGLEDNGFGLTKNYLYTRLWAAVFHGRGWGPDSWQVAIAELNRTGYQWNNDPGELWADMFLIAVRGIYTTVQSPTSVGYVKVNMYGVTPNPAAMRKLMLDLMHEKSPVVYPSPPGQTMVAKSEDDTLLVYQTTDDKLITRDAALNTLGTYKRV